MSASHKFQLALHLKSLRNIGVRQSCYLQARTIVYHKNDKKQNVTAKPYEILNLVPVENQPQQNAAVLEDDTFLSPRILIKHADKNIGINSVCLFKGQINIPTNVQHEHQLFIFSQLIWYMGKEVEVVGEWKGYSKLTSFDSYLDIYYSSHILTCSIQASAHCILSQIQIRNENKLMQIQKQKIFYNHALKKSTNLYNACIDPLIKSLDLLVEWVRQFNKNHYQSQQQKRDKGIYLQNISDSWKYNSLIKNLGLRSQQQLSKLLLTLNDQQFFNNVKADSYNLSGHLYLLWKQFLTMFQKYPDSLYFKKLKQNYHKCMEKDHWQNRIIVIGDNKQEVKQVFQASSEQLQFCSVEQHTSQIRLSCRDMQILNNSITRKKDKLIVLVHGFQASSFDMEIIAMYFKFRNPDLHLLISEANEGQTQNGIQECGHRLAVQIKNYINSRELKSFSISLIGHSLGGVIIRSALRYLQLYKNSFECYVSICSPHLGYLYHTSTIVTTSMWVMNQIKKDLSLIQLSLSDNKNLHKCFIYQLSQRNQLSWFSTVILMGSRQDQYVPFSSAMLQNMEFFYKSEAAKTYQQMYNNIIKPIQSKIIRLQILFNDKVKDLSGFIGRTAHIKVLSFLPVIDLYCHLISKRI